MAKKETKTNAVRMLERMKIPHEQLLYECDAFTDGSDMADKQGLPQKHITSAAARSLSLFPAHPGRRVRPRKRQAPGGPVPGDQNGASARQPIGRVSTTS